MTNNFSIRLISSADAQPTLNIYAPYIQTTVVSFEYEVPALHEWQERIDNITTELPWLVCEHIGEVIGYAYASKHRNRMAYSWSADSAIYVREDFHHKGVARILYQTLFELLQLQGYVNVYAGITMPNAKSEGFHRSMGFEEIGVYKKVGFKFGQWHDTKWFGLRLVEIAHPLKLKTIQEVTNSDAFKHILQKANTKLNQ